MYMNRNILQGLFLVLLATTGFCQKEGRDVVLLHDGDTLRGTIIEQRPGKHIKLLQQPSLDTLFIEYGRIEALQYVIPPTPDISDHQDTLQRNDSLTKTPSDDILSRDFNQRKTYIGIGVAAGGGVWSNIGIGGNFLYTIHPELQVGVSLYFYQGTGQETVISQTLPLSAEVVYTVGTNRSGRLSSLLGASLGYAFNLNGPPSTGTPLLLKNGLYLNPFLGGRINFTSNSGIRLDVGYQFVSGSTYIKSTGDFFQRNRQHNILCKATIFF